MMRIKPPVGFYLLKKLSSLVLDKTAFDQWVFKTILLHCENFEGALSWQWEVATSRIIFPLSHKK